MNPFLHACLNTCLTMQAIGLSIGSLILCCPHYHELKIADALEPLLACLILGAVITFVPVLLFAWVVTSFTRRTIAKHQPRWSPYLFSIALALVFFFSLTSLSSRPIPDRIRSFQQQAPDVLRPALSRDEIPLLLTTLVAALFGTFICHRTLHPNLNKSQNSTSKLLVI